MILSVAMHCGRINRSSHSPMNWMELYSRQASLGNIVGGTYSSGAGWYNGMEGIPTSIRPRLKLWFVKLALASQGILYEDTVIRWWWLLYL